MLLRRIESLLINSVIKDVDLCRIKAFQVNGGIRGRLAVCSHACRQPIEYTHQFQRARRVIVPDVTPTGEDMPYTRNASRSNGRNRGFQHERVHHVETAVPEKSGHAHGLGKTARSPDVRCIKGIQRSEYRVSFLRLVVFQGH